MNTSTFHRFFDCCVGSWVTERTYHYLASREVERSRTEFVIHPLTAERKTKVLSDNQYAPTPELGNLPGYNLGFHTVSETGEEVSQNLNILFVPKQEQDLVIKGDYLRDRAYEEAKPIVSHFRFDSRTNELLMTTNYTRVVAVDSITLINSELRIRKIVTYQRPPLGEELKNVVLVGFGVEQKQASSDNF
ncbi:MAG: phycobiliprotein lyase [Cyanophyceae cyanobacterium]